MTAATAPMAAATALPVAATTMAIAGGRSNAGNSRKQMLSANPTSGGVHPQPEECFPIGTSNRAPAKRYWKSGRGPARGCMNWCTIICVIGLVIVLLVV
tara:strand:+ start:73 stop:369 length:297 start_codon:yes stop_codon:yes gene_type:complete